MKKMMFNKRYGLEQAVIDRLKWKTRRMIPEKEEPRIKAFQEEYYEASLDWLEGKDLLEAYYLVNHKERLPYKVGEVVAVAQCYSDVAQAAYPFDRKFYAFKAANRKECKKGALKNSVGWNNKMFVRAGIMPHRIRIIDVQIERLQDISDDDCIAEGIMNYSTPSEKRFGYRDFKREDIICRRTPREAYSTLIDNVSGKGTWKLNPFVFVYTFELVQ